MILCFCLEVGITYKEYGYDMAYEHVKPLKKYDTMMQLHNYVCVYSCVYIQYTLKTLDYKNKFY